MRRKASHPSDLVVRFIRVIDVRNVAHRRVGRMTTNPRRKRPTPYQPSRAAGPILREAYDRKQSFATESLSCEVRENCRPREDCSFGEGAILVDCSRRLVQAI